MSLNSLEHLPTILTYKQDYPVTPR